MSDYSVNAGFFNRFYGRSVPPENQQPIIWNNAQNDQIILDDLDNFQNNINNLQPQNNEREKYRNLLPPKKLSGRVSIPQSSIHENIEISGPTLAEELELKANTGVFNKTKALFNSFAGLSLAATNPGRVVKELAEGVEKALNEDSQLVETIYNFLRGVKSEGEGVLEELLEEPGLFEKQRKLVEDLHEWSNDPLISDEKFNKRLKKAKKKMFMGILKTHLSNVAEGASYSASKGFLNAFIDKVMEKEEQASVNNSVNIINEGGYEEQPFSVEKKRATLLEALAHCMDTLADHGVALFNKKLIEQLSPESQEPNIYSIVAQAVKDISSKVLVEVEERLEDMMTKVVDKRIEPVMNTFAPLMASANRFLNEVTPIVSSVKRGLGIPDVPQPAVAPNNGPNIINGAPPQQQPEPAPLNNIINNDQGVQPPKIVELGGVGSKLMGYLANNILGGAVESVPPIVVNQMAKLLKWGINYAKENISKPEGVEDDENEPLFDGLITALDQIIDKEGKPPFETAQEIYKALQAFAKNVSDNGGLVTIDGFPFLSFLFDKSADFSATPTFDNAIAEMGKTPREVLNPEDSDDDSGDAVVSIHPFKKNMAKYIGARVTYEVIAGLKPKGNFYMDLFAKSRRNEKLEENLFSALDKAHAKGKISAVRLWLTKLAYSFVQPMSKLFFDPFIDNGDRQAKSLRKKKIAEKTAEEFRGEVTNYAAGVVNAYEDIAKGLGDRSKNIDGAMMEKLKEPAYNGGRTVKERHLKMATTAIEDLGPGFTFANRYFKRLSCAKFADKSYFKILNLPMAVLKIPFYLMGSIVLYPLQSIMTRGLKWGMKKAMEGVDLVDDVVEKSSAAFDNDLNLKRVKLQGIHDFLINMIAKGKHLEEGKEVEKSVISDGDKKKFRSVVANILLAMEYNNAETIPELQEIIEDNRTSSKNAFSFLGIKVDVNKYVHKKIHESIVEKVAEGYKQAIDENLVAQQVNNIKKTMNGIFDQRNSADVKSLKEDIHRLERENEALLEEAIKTFVKQVVDEELDTSGDKRLQKLAGVTKTFKAKLVKYVERQEGIKTLDLGNNKAQMNIGRLLSGAEFSRKSVTKILLDPKNKKLNKLHYQKFSELHVTYTNSLHALERSLDNIHLQTTQEAFNVLHKWQENIQIPKGTNISFFPEAVQVVKDVAKGGVRDQAKKKIDSFMDLMFKQWNVAALANMGMTMYGDRRFPFQKGK
ncbi:MAG: hypothetical protein V4494_05125 [Chlamydiota bacterium]